MRASRQTLLRSVKSFSFPFRASTICSMWKYLSVFISICMVIWYILFWYRWKNFKMFMSLACRIIGPKWFIQTQEMSLCLVKMTVSNQNFNFHNVIHITFQSQKVISICYYLITISNLNCTFLSQYEEALHC